MKIKGNNAYLYLSHYLVFKSLNYIKELRLWCHHVSQTVFSDLYSWNHRSKLGGGEREREKMQCENAQSWKAVVWDVLSSRDKKPPTLQLEEGYHLLPDEGEKEEEMGESRARRGESQGTSKVNRSGGRGKEEKGEETETGEDKETRFINKKGRTSWPWVGVKQPLEVRTFPGMVVCSNNRSSGVVDTIECVRWPHN